MYLLHKIYDAQIGALVNNAVEVGEEDVGSRHVFSLTRVLAHLEAQTEILLCVREKHTLRHCRLHARNSEFSFYFSHTLE